MSYELIHQLEKKIIVGDLNANIGQRRYFSELLEDGAHMRYPTVMD
jgi:hypothetical protein